MAELPEATIGIYFTVTREFLWEGDISQLPASLRKGVVDKAGEIDFENLRNNIDNDIDSVLAKLEKKADVQDERFELDEIEEH